MADARRVHSVVSISKLLPSGTREGVESGAARVLRLACTAASSHPARSSRFKAVSSLIPGLP